jgi:hypothetical protein
MERVSIDQFKKNIDKYLESDLEEEIEVFDKDRTLFYITPKRIKLLRDVESMFGSLPREAYYDEDIDRE